MIENSGHAPLWAAAPHQAQTQAKPPVREVRQSTGSDGATGANVAGNPQRGEAQPEREEQIRLPPPLPDLSRPSGPPPAFEMSVLEVERAMRGVPEGEPAEAPPEAEPEPPEVETPKAADTSATEQAVNEIREIEQPEPQPDFDEKR